MTQTHDQCLFCKIIEKEIPADVVYESEEILAFKDIKPQAPVHLLIIPKKHIPTLNNITELDKNLIADLQLTAIQLAKKNNISETGYRILFNCNSQGGQEIYHIHLHLIGGRQMAWPPG